MNPWKPGDFWRPGQSGNPAGVWKPGQSGNPKGKTMPPEKREKIEQYLVERGYVQSFKEIGFRHECSHDTVLKIYRRLVSEGRITKPK